MLIKVQVFPRAKKREVIKKAEDRFEVRVRAKPREGEANREVVQLLADYFQIPKERIRLFRGSKRQNKILEILEE